MEELIISNGTKKIETKLKDCFIIEPKRFGDERGYYESIFVSNSLEELGIPKNKIEQFAESKSAKGTVRGLHFQNDPYCQAKYVRCVQGGVLDVVVDLRKDSPSYKKWIAVELTPENGRMLYVPRGFAHGFVSLKENTKFQYFVDNHYKPNYENGILWNDSEINIDWQFDKYDIENPLLSEKDKKRKGIGEMQPDFYMHKRYLVTGVKGQLGYDIVRELNKRGIYDILALDVEDMDITDCEIVDKIITEYKPEYVIHCAAYTNVDKAEENENLAEKINVDGTRNIAKACKKVNAKMVYVSTDYVFDGELNSNYSYETTDKASPQNIYGMTKYQGEIVAQKENDKTFVVRTAWVFGINGNNFVKTMLNLSEKHDKLQVVNDQIGSPTYTVDLAKTIIDLLNTDEYGIYHATNDGFCSWAEFAKYILKDTETEVVPVSTEEYYKPKYEEASKNGITLHIAKRPMISKLSKAKLEKVGIGLLPNWMNAVDRFQEELNKQKVMKK